jgi:hypothetical protein
MSYYTLTQKQYPSIEGDESVNLSQLETFYKKNVSDEKDEDEKDDNPYYIVLVGSTSILKFSDPVDRDRAMEDLIEETKNMNNTVTSDIKNFVKEHRQIIYWVVLALIVDHVFLNGQLRSKIKNIIQGLLNKAEASITGKPVETIEVTTNQN